MAQTANTSAGSAFQPEPAEIVVRRILERRLERRVADQKRRLGTLAEWDVRRLGQQHLRQDDGRRRLRRHGDGAHGLSGVLHELDRVDCA